MLPAARRRDRGSFVVRFRLHTFDNDALCLVLAFVDGSGATKNNPKALGALLERERDLGFFGVPILKQMHG